MEIPVFTSEFATLAEKSYSLALALEDFLPVFFSILGTYFISQVIARMDTKERNMATLGWLLVGLGGFCKALWKLLIAAGIGDFVVLDNALFPLLGPGFTLLAGAAGNAYRTVKGAPPHRRWRWALLIAGIHVVGALAAAIFVPSKPDSLPIWKLIMLELTTISNIVYGVVLILLALQNRAVSLAIIFGVWLALIFVLQGLARATDHSETAQWLEQGLNTVGQASYAWAAWQLLKKVRK